MSGKKIFVQFVLVLTVVLMAVGCGVLVPEATPAGPEAPAQLEPTPTRAGVVIEPGESAPEREASVAGRYRLKPPGYEYAQTVEEDYYLVLNEDYTALFEEQKIGQSEVTVIARGTWQLDGEGVIIELTELLGEPVATPDVLKYEYIDGFPVATEYAVGDTLYNLEEAEFTIGSGERHPLVRELHKRLAAIDYLNFTDPGDDLYTEATRRAVVAFQEAQGLLPNGEVDPGTWVLLGSPPPPLPTPTPMDLGTPIVGAPDLSRLATHTDDGSPIVYLTFDDGPNGTQTQEIIDLLARYDAQGTFFVLGQMAERYPNLVRAEAMGGHYVANHTYNHSSLEGATPEQFMDQIERTKHIILDIALDLFSLDRDVRYLRPPYGATDANTRSYANSLGYAVVMWDIDPQDWRNPGAQVIAAHIVSSVYPGAIVLMHDGGGDRSQTVTALERVLRELSAQGYVFRNVFVG